MVISYKTVKEYENIEELTEKEVQALENYIERKKEAPCTSTWHQEQLGQAEEILYKQTRKLQEATV